jgi:hypothetical protein
LIEEIALNDGIDAIESVAHGDGSGGSLALVAGPSAEACDGPGGPGEAVSKIGILLLAGAALQAQLQGRENLPLALVKDLRHRLAVARQGKARASTGCIVWQAPISAMTASFSSASPCVTKLSSRSRPRLLTVRNNCSMCQRWRYQPATSNRRYSRKSISDVGLTEDEFRELL